MKNSLIVNEDPLNEALSLSLLITVDGVLSLYWSSTDEREREASADLHFLSFFLFSFINNQLQLIMKEKEKSIERKCHL